MFTRADERESGAAYRRLWRDTSPVAMLERFLMGPLGTFLLNTPVFLLQRHLTLRPEQRLLEIGCGRATTLRILSGRVHFQQPPVGIDIAPSALTLAQRDGLNGPPVELAAANATRLPFAADSFDLVLSGYMVKHLGDQAMARFLYETWRVLKPSGILVVWEFAPTSSRTLNRFHRWLLTQRVKPYRLRGFGDFLDLAIESPYVTMEILNLRPFLFPPIPRTAFFLTKSADGRRRL